MLCGKIPTYEPIQTLVNDITNLLQVTTWPSIAGKVPGGVLYTNAIAAPAQNARASVLAANVACGLCEIAA
jgi:hypothetical protein